MAHAGSRRASALLFLIITEIRAVHDFRGRVSGLHRQEPERADAQRRVGLPVLATICLLSSSVTDLFAEHALKRKGHWAYSSCGGSPPSCSGSNFCTATGIEWHKLIYKDHLTIGTNLFGTTYYSLVGLHASHVIVGMVLYACVMLVTLCGISDSRTVPASAVPFVVLAFRRCGVGGGLYGCVCDREIIHMEQQIEYGEAGERTGQPRFEMPAATIQPLILAFGLMLIFAGWILYGPLTFIGMVLAIIGIAGWFRNVIPDEAHEFASCRC